MDSFSIFHMPPAPLQFDKLCWQLRKSLKASPLKTKLKDIVPAKHRKRARFPQIGWALKLDRSSRSRWIHFHNLPKTQLCVDLTFLEESIATECTAFVISLCSKFLFSRKLPPNLWHDEFFMSSCYCLHIHHIAQFEIFIWFSALHGGWAYSCAFWPLWTTRELVSTISVSTLCPYGRHQTSSAFAMRSIA